MRGGCEQALAAARPRWIDHMLLNEIFDGDMAYLAKASQYAKARPTGPSSACPMLWKSASKPLVVFQLSAGDVKQGLRGAMLRQSRGTAGDVCMRTLYAQTTQLTSNVPARDHCCNTLLSVQERDPGGETWAQDYYLPAGADKCASAVTQHTFYLQAFDEEAIILFWEDMLIHPAFVCFCPPFPPCDPPGTHYCVHNTLSNVVTVYCKSVMRWPLGVD